jgi:hypothetical protein
LYRPDHPRQAELKPSDDTFFSGGSHQPLVVAGVFKELKCGTHLAAKI